VYPAGWVVRSARPELRCERLTKGRRNCEEKNSRNREVRGQKRAGGTRKGEAEERRKCRKASGGKRKAVTKCKREVELCCGEMTG
jgi:hypothetical protein